MGSAGRTPMFHVGGVQEGKAVAPPTLARAVPLLLPVLLVVLVKAATWGLVVVQVSGGLAWVAPKVSTTVAVMFTLPPLFMMTEFPAWLCPPIWSLRYWTRQVVYGNGLLVVSETLAKRLVMPGDLALVLAWLSTLG